VLTSCSSNLTEYFMAEYVSLTENSDLNNIFDYEKSDIL
jgi:hypothetical protein